MDPPFAKRKDDEKVDDTTGHPIPPRTYGTIDRPGQSQAGNTESLPRSPRYLTYRHSFIISLIFLFAIFLFFGSPTRDNTKTIDVAGSAYHTGDSVISSQKPASGGRIANEVLFEKPKPQVVASESSGQSGDSDAGTTPFVAFGDSFAAGMGTGNTSWDGCRQGEFSYPKFIASATKNENHFQNLPCSGATLDSVLLGSEGSQIEAWENANRTKFATLTVGGNDVGFYDVLTACVARVGGIFAGDCDAQLAEANETIHSDEFFAKQQMAMEQIISKANNTSFRLFSVGYPRFFDADQDDCEQVTFGFWNPHHNIGYQSDWSAVWLHKGLRMVLNDLIFELDQVILKATKAVNTRYMETRQTMPVTFINPNDVFQTHRFCEGDAKEPDSARMQTWFFLSGWDDIVADEILDEAPEAPPSDPKAVEIGGKNTTKLPDPKTCREDLKRVGNHDWAGMFDTLLKTLHS